MGQMDLEVGPVYQIWFTICSSFLVITICVILTYSRKRHRLAQQLFSKPEPEPVPDVNWKIFPDGDDIITGTSQNRNNSELFNVNFETTDNLEGQLFEEDIQDTDHLEGQLFEEDTRNAEIPPFYTSTEITDYIESHLFEEEVTNLKSTENEDIEVTDFCGTESTNLPAPTYKEDLDGSQSDSNVDDRIITAGHNRLSGEYDFNLSAFADVINRFVEDESWENGEVLQHERIPPGFSNNTHVDISVFDFTSYTDGIISAFDIGIKNNTKDYLSDYASKEDSYESFASSSQRSVEASNQSFSCTDDDKASTQSNLVEPHRDMLNSTCDISSVTRKLESEMSALESDVDHINDSSAEFRNIRKGLNRILPQEKQKARKKTSKNVLAKKFGKHSVNHDVSKQVLEEVTVERTTFVFEDESGTIFLAQTEHEVDEMDTEIHKFNINNISTTKSIKTKTSKTKSPRTIKNRLINKGTTLVKREIQTRPEKTTKFEKQNTLSKEKQGHMTDVEKIESIHTNTSPKPESKLHKYPRPKIVIAYENTDGPVSQFLPSKTISIRNIKSFDLKSTINNPQYEKVASSNPATTKSEPLNSNKAKIKLANLFLDESEVECKSILSNDSNLLTEQTLPTHVILSERKLRHGKIIDLETSFEEIESSVHETTELRHVTKTNTEPTVNVINNLCDQINLQQDTNSKKSITIVLPENDNILETEISVKTFCTSNSFVKATVKQMKTSITDLEKRIEATRRELSQASVELFKTTLTDEGSQTTFEIFKNKQTDEGFQPTTDSILSLQNCIVQKGCNETLCEDTVHLQDMMVYHTTTDQTEPHSPMRPEKNIVETDLSSSDNTESVIVLPSTLSEDDEKVINVGFSKTTTNSDEDKKTSFNSNLSDSKMEFVSVNCCSFHAFAHSAGPSATPSTLYTSNTSGVPETESEKVYSTESVDTSPTKSENEIVSQIQENIKNSILNELLVVSDKPHYTGRATTNVVPIYTKSKTNLTDESISEHTVTTNYSNKLNSASCDSELTGIKPKLNEQTSQQVVANFSTSTIEKSNINNRKNNNPTIINNRYFEKVVCQDENKTRMMNMILMLTENSKENDNTPSSDNHATEKEILFPKQEVEGSAQQDCIVTGVFCEENSSQNTIETNIKVCEIVSNLSEQAHPKNYNNETNITKTLRFKGADHAKDTTTIIVNPLKKTSLGDTSCKSEKLKKAYVIPSFIKEVTDDIKDLIDDLVKPVRDVNALSGEPVKKFSACSLEIQTDLFSSSQIDLEPTDPYVLVPRKNVETNLNLRYVKSSVNKNSISTTLSVKPKNINPVKLKVPLVLEFDRFNPLNNVLLHVDDVKDKRKNRQIESPNIDHQFCEVDTKKNHVDSKLDNNKQYILRGTADYLPLIMSMGQEQNTFRTADQDIKKTEWKSLSKIQELALNDINPTLIDQDRKTTLRYYEHKEINTDIVMQDNEMLLKEVASLTFVSSLHDRALHKSNLESKKPKNYSTLPLKPNKLYTTSPLKTFYNQVGETSRESSKPDSKRKKNNPILSELDVIPNKLSKTSELRKRESLANTLNPVSSRVKPNSCIFPESRSKEDNIKPFRATASFIERNRMRTNLKSKSHIVQQRTSEC